jgi:hypothetical protein
MCPAWLPSVRGQEGSRSPSFLSIPSGGVPMNAPNTIPPALEARFAHGWELWTAGGKGLRLKLG